MKAFHIILTLLVAIITAAVRGHGAHDHDELNHHVGSLRSYTAVHRNQTITVDASIFHDKAKLAKSRSRCGTHNPDHEEMARVDAQMREKLRARGMVDWGKIRGIKKNYIPVYWHRLMTDDASEGRVSKKKIRNSIKELNKAFGKKIFKLEDIITTRNSEWFYMTSDDTDEIEAKSALRRGGPDALNIYSCRPDFEWFGNFYPLLGFATFPWWYEDNPLLDGVVIQDDTVPGGGNPYGFDEGDTLTHEVGHWLGLYHVFQDETCDYDGDQVSGTNYQSEATSGCPSSQDSCPNKSGLDNIHNFMDYSDDVCLYEFEATQFRRMAEMYYTYRYTEEA